MKPNLDFGTNASEPFLFTECTASRKHLFNNVSGGQWVRLDEMHNYATIKIKLQ